MEEENKVVEEGKDVAEETKSVEEVKESAEETTATDEVKEAAEEVKEATEEPKALEETCAAEENTAPVQQYQVAEAYQAYETAESSGDRIPRSRFAAGMLAVFPCGGLGAYNYYLGDKKNGIIKSIVGGIGAFLIGFGAPFIAFYGLGLIICFFGVLAFGGMYVWAIIDGVAIFKGKTNTDAMGCELTDGPKSRLATLLLGVLCGFGIHNFYIGNKKRAIIQLAVSAGCTIIPALAVGVTGMYIWGVVESIMVMCGKTTVDAEGNPFGR